MAEVVGGRRTKKGPQRDGDGHRTYRVTHLVKVNPDSEAGFAALNASDLPLPGDTYDFDGDYDPWAFCGPEADVQAHEEKEGERPEFYTVEQIFSTKPRKKCSDQVREDPLLEPMRVSGDFKNRKEESSFDMFGKPIVTSSWELIRGKENEWDVSTASVNVEMNVAVLELSLCTYMMNRVNAYTLWGLPPRTIKLSGFSWEQKYYGQCYTYYTRRFSFDIDFRGWDRRILDEGTKALRGKWIKNWVAGQPPIYRLENNPNRFRPGDFIRYTDPNGQPNKIILNGFGVPSGVCVDYSLSDPANVPDDGQDPAKYYLAVPEENDISSRTTTGVPLDDGRRWVLLTAGDTPSVFDAETYNENTNYFRGRIVEFAVGTPNLYVCVSDAMGEPPAQLVGSTFETSFSWRRIGALSLRGVYDNDTAYAIGDVVRVDPPATALTAVGSGSPGVGCTPTQTGYRFIQKYFGGNLLQLGIPLLV